MFSKILRWVNYFGGGLGIFLGGIWAVFGPGLFAPNGYQIYPVVLIVTFPLLLLSVFAIGAGYLLPYMPVASGIIQLAVGFLWIIPGSLYAFFLIPPLPGPIHFITGIITLIWHRRLKKFDQLPFPPTAFNAAMPFNAIPPAITLQPRYPNWQKRQKVARRLLLAVTIFLVIEAIAIVVYGLLVVTEPKLFGIKADGISVFWLVVGIAYELLLLIFVWLSYFSWKLMATDPPRGIRLSYICAAVSFVSGSLPIAILFGLAGMLMSSSLQQVPVPTKL